MKMLQRLRVGMRLALGFGLLLALLAASTSLAVHRLGGIEDQIHEITEVHNQKLYQLTKMRRDNLRIETTIRDLIIAPAQARDGIVARVGELRGGYAESAAALDGFSFTGAEAKAREAISAAELAAREKTNAIIEMAMADQQEEAAAMLFEPGRGAVQPPLGRHPGSRRPGEHPARRFRAACQRGCGRRHLDAAGVRHRGRGGRRAVGLAHHPQPGGSVAAGDRRGRRHRARAPGQCDPGAAGR